MTLGINTVLSVVSDPDRMEETLTQASGLARGFDAHLDVLAFGVDRTQAGFYYAGASPIVLQESMTRAQNDADALANSARGFLGAMGGRFSVEGRLSPLSDVGRHAAELARFADLVVLSRPYGAKCGPEEEVIAEAALFEGQAPVLVLPERTAPGPAPERVILAWDESGEALRAARSALPLLRAASEVIVVMVAPPVRGTGRSDPGGQIAQWLARHEVKVRIDILSKSLPRVSDVLNRHVEDVNAQMIVMGAYGHSRFREAILGGATRNMLEAAEVPVFLAH